MRYEVTFISWFLFAFVNVENAVWKVVLRDECVTLWRLNGVIRSIHVAKVFFIINNKELPYKMVIILYALSINNNNNLLFLYTYICV